MKSYRLILIVLCLLSPVLGQAQQEMSVFTAAGRAGVSVTMTRDYQSVGINPANLGIIYHNDSMSERSKRFSLGLAEIGASVSSDALERKELRENFFSIDALRGTTDPLSLEEKAEAAVEFVNAGVNFSSDVMLLGLAVQPSRDIGGFALNIRDRFRSTFKFNTDGAEVVFQGYNADYFDSLAINGTDTVGIATNPMSFGQLFEGSRLGLNWYREIALSYGRVLIDGDAFRMYVGVGGKYLMGVGYLDVEAEGGRFSAVSALGPVFQVNYPISTPNPVTSGNLQMVGSGFAFDAGITVAVGQDEQFKFGVSLTDLGSITWDRNLYEGKDTLFDTFDQSGIDTYNLIEEGRDLTANGNFFVWQGAESVKVPLPSQLRIGLSYRPIEMFEIGADIIMPFNDEVGNLEQVLVAVGADFMPVPWFRLSSGASISKDYGFNIPIGVYFTAPMDVYEVGIASRDAISFFARNTPTLSVAFGFLRFKF